MWFQYSSIESLVVFSWHAVNKFHLLYLMHSLRAGRAYITKCNTIIDYIPKYVHGTYPFEVGGPGLKAGRKRGLC